MDPTPSLDDLIWLFEAEPRGEYEDWERQWPYSEVIFATQRGSWGVHFVLWPGGETAQLRLEQGGEQRVALALKRVVTVDAERLHGEEALRVHFREDDPLRTLRLRLKPSVSLHWDMEEWVPTGGG